MLLRNKKENDVNEGKWIGVGGHLEKGESPEECCKREIKEETGLNVYSLDFHGYITFPGINHGEDELMFIYTTSDFDGELIECNEGTLKWIDDDSILSLHLWEGDKHIHRWLKDQLIHRAKMVYDHDRLIEYIEY